VTGWKPVDVVVLLLTLTLAVVVVVTLLGHTDCDDPFSPGALDKFASLLSAMAAAVTLYIGHSLGVNTRAQLGNKEK